MTIYFCGSIAGGRDFLETYTKIVRYVQGLGHTVPTEHIIDPNVLDGEKKHTAREVYERDVAWLNGADGAIAEISNPSLGVGYEIGYALDNGKKVLAMYQKGLFVSRMITGNPHPNLTVVEYASDEEAKSLIDKFIKQELS